MNDEELKTFVNDVFQVGHKSGIIDLASELGLLTEKLSEIKAKKIYGVRMLLEWQQKGWIKTYSTGNPVRAKVYYLRSELERAKQKHELTILVARQNVKSLLKQIKKY